MKSRWLVGLLAVAALWACGPRPERARVAVAPSLRWAHGPSRPEAPVLVLVHGLGDTPEGILSLTGALQLEVEAHAPQAPAPWNKGFSWFSPGAASQDPAELCTEVQAAADRIAEDLRRLDLSNSGRRKVALTGFSQGGILAFQLAFRHGDLFDVVAPLAGHIPAPCLPSGGPDPTTPPVVAFHGDADPLLPVGNVRDGIDALARQGWPARLLSYPKLTHQVSRALVEDLSQSLENGLSGEASAPAVLPP